MTDPLGTMSLISKVESAGCNRRWASDAHQPRPAVRRRLLGQPIGVPRFENDRVDFVPTKRLILFGGPEL
jgi:hypothetical protein